MSRFRRIDDGASTGKQEQPIPAVLLWIPPANKLFAEEHLFHFLRSVRDGRPRATEPLLLEKSTLHALYTDPHPDLRVAMQHCLDQFLVKHAPDIPRQGTALSLSTTVLGMALAIYNCLSVSFAGASEAVEDPVIPFTSELVKTLPPARTMSEMLAYHMLLHDSAEFLPLVPEGRAELLKKLLNLSPLSAAYFLHLYTPPPLTLLAAELWPWWNTAEMAPWTDRGDWLQALVALLEGPKDHTGARGWSRNLRAFLRRRWLSLPATRLACRNLGLLLEALRQRGGQDALILEFYEAFDFFRSEKRITTLHDTVRIWPLLDQIDCLLRAAGDSETAIQLNRRGNEYFALFLALINIIAEQGLGPVNDYHLLTREFIKALCDLLRLTTIEYLVEHMDLGTIEYTSEDQR